MRRLVAVPFIQGPHPAESDTDIGADSAERAAVGNRSFFTLLRRLATGICALTLALGVLAAPAAARGIAFVGDSMADGIWGAFVRLSATATCPTDFGLFREAQNGTGLTRPDRLDWSAQIAAIQAERSPDLFVISVGLNDRQPIVLADGSRVPLGTQAWVDAYRQNVLNMVAHATSTGATAMMVGIPALRDEEANSHALLLNQIFEDVARTTQHVMYVSPWHLQGATGFSSFGAGPHGNVVQLRAPDGVHFTQTGYDLLGLYLRPVVVQAITAVENDGAIVSCFGA